MIGTGRIWRSIYRIFFTFIGVIKEVLYCRLDDVPFSSLFRVELHCEGGHIILMVKTQSYRRVRFQTGAVLPRTTRRQTDDLIC